MTKFERIDVEEQVSIGSLISERRKAVGMTQRQLADRAGVNLNTLKSYETGRTSPTVANVLAIAEELGLSQDEIWNEAQKPEEVRPNASGAALNVETLPYDSAVALFKKLAAKVGEPIEPKSQNPIDVLRDVVVERGLRGKRTIAAVTAAETTLAELDADELDELADEDRIVVDMEAVVKAANGNPDAIEQFLIARIIIAALYGNDIVARDDDAKAVFAAVYEEKLPAGIPEIEDEELFYIVGDPSDASAETARVYAPVLLLELVKKRKAPDAEELFPNKD